MPPWSHRARLPWPTRPVRPRRNALPSERCGAGTPTECHLVQTNGNSAEVVGQVGNLRRVGNPPELLVNRRAGVVRPRETKWHQAGVTRCQMKSVPMSGDVSGRSAYATWRCRRRVGKQGVVRGPAASRADQLVGRRVRSMRSGAATRGRHRDRLRFPCANTSGIPGAGTDSCSA